MRQPLFLRRILQARHRVCPPLALASKRIYVLPVRAGLVFGFFLLAMLVAAINYTNNLAFLLAFLLGSIAILSAVHAYANLLGLEIEQARLVPAYCGENVRLQLFFRAAGRSRRSLWVSLGQHRVFFSLFPEERHLVELSVPTSRRGRLEPEQVRILTRYPLGLFRAWSPLVLDISGLVYPRPIAPQPQDWEVCGARGEGAGAVSQSGEFSGVRPYRPEDGLSRVSWKASAKGAGLYAKEYSSHLAKTMIFDWNRLGGGYEERISRLAGLVREAEQQGLRYGVSLPGRTLEPGQGSGHAHQCLEALALMPEQP